MPINTTAFATPVAQLIDIIPNVAGALSLATNTADDLNLNVKPQTNKIPDIDTAAKSALSKSDEALASGFNAIQRADRAIDTAGDAILTSNLAIDDAGRAMAKADDALSVGRDALGKAGTALGNAADLFDRVVNIFNLIATLATAARMEFIAADLNSKINVINQALNEIYSSIGNINATNADQQNAINDLYGQIDMIAGQLNSILNAIAAQSQYLIPTYNNSFQALYKLDSLIGLEGATQSKIDSLTQLEIQTQTQVSSGFANLPPQMKTAVCEALNSDCFDFPAPSSGCDLQPVLNAVNALQQGVNSISGAVGSGTGSCGVNFAFGSLTDGLESLVCGRGGFNFNEALEDYFANNEAVDLQPVLDKVEEKGNEVIAEVKKIPEPYLFVPQSWQYRIAGNRPQLFAGMYEKGKDSLSPSKWDICIPHVRSDISSFSLEDLKTYFRPYRRGKFYARATLNDGCAFVIHADTTVAATNYINRLIELIDSSQIPEKDFISTGENPRISRSVNVEVRAFGYYATGRKQGEKPTKRWYFPLVETAPA